MVDVSWFAEVPSALGDGYSGDEVAKVMEGYHGLQGVSKIWQLDDACCRTVRSRQRPNFFLHANGFFLGHVVWVLIRKLLAFSFYALSPHDV